MSLLPALFRDATESLSIENFAPYIQEAPALQNGQYCFSEKAEELIKGVYCEFCLVKSEDSIRPIAVSSTIALGRFKEVKLALDIVSQATCVCMHAINGHSSTHLKAEYHNALSVKDCEAFPRVLGFYDSVVDSDAFVLTEFAGDSLANYLSNNAAWRLSTERIIHIAQTTTEALLFLQDKNLVHTDLKPENLLSHDLYAAYPTVKICDLESLIEGNRKLEQPDYIGSVAYHLPEHDEYICGTKSDILITKAIMGWTVTLVTMRLFKQNFHRFMQSGTKSAAMTLPSWRNDFFDAIYNDLNSNVFQKKDRQCYLFGHWLLQSLVTDPDMRLKLEDFPPCLTAAQKETFPILSLNEEQQIFAGIKQLAPAIASDTTASKQLFYCLAKAYVERSSVSPSDYQGAYSAWSLVYKDDKVFIYYESPFVASAVSLKNANFVEIH